MPDFKVALGVLTFKGAKCNYNLTLKQRGRDGSITMSGALGVVIGSFKQS